ncbi:pknB-group protein kinase [Streptomyces albidoflavus]|nr:pknB-group protein kinase [Streptomyces albidoflavus]
MSLRGSDPAEIGGYPLEARLGSGGMGTVFLARTSSGRPVAIKLIHQQFAGDEEFRIRFRQEVAAARRVSGAFTAAVVDAAPEAEQPWMATTYIEGQTLAQHIAAAGPLDGVELRRLAIGLAEALRDIHRVGVVHRDLKPSNVVLSAEGPRVIDFGISRAADQQTLTMTGRVIGTPPFMSPEQLQAPRGVGPASDIFSLGTLLVYAATGSGPFDADSPYMTAYQVVHEEPSLGAVPEALRAVVGSCLDKEPAGRPSADDLLVLLRDLPADLGGAGPTGTRAGRTRDVITQHHDALPTPFVHRQKKKKKKKNRHLRRPPAARPVAAGPRGGGRGGGHRRGRGRAPVRRPGRRRRRRQGRERGRARGLAARGLRAVAQDRSGRPRGHRRRTAVRGAGQGALLRGRRRRRGPRRRPRRLARVDGEEPGRPRTGHLPGRGHRRHGARLPLRRRGRTRGPAERGRRPRRGERPRAVVRADRRPVHGGHRPEPGRRGVRFHRPHGRRGQLPPGGPGRAQRRGHLGDTVPLGDALRPRPGREPPSRDVRPRHGTRRVEGEPPRRAPARPRLREAGPAPRRQGPGRRGGRRGRRTRPPPGALGGPRHHRLRRDRPRGPGLPRGRLRPPEGHVRGDARDGGRHRPPERGDRADHRVRPRHRPREVGAADGGGGRLRTHRRGRGALLQLVHRPGGGAGPGRRDDPVVHRPAGRRAHR